MGYETVKLEKEDRVATIIFNRMEKKNAANHQVFKDLDAALTNIEEDASMRVVVLTGQDDVFSAGADVSGFDFQKVSTGMYFMELVAKAFNHFEYIPKPVVMAVNGIAYGFGTGITLTGDIVIASDRAKFSIREINHGAIPIETLTRGMEVMGKHRIAYLSLMANDITAEEAKAIGLVNTVVPHGQVEGRGGQGVRQAEGRCALRPGRHQTDTEPQVPRRLGLRAGNNARCLRHR